MSMKCTIAVLAGVLSIGDVQLALGAPSEQGGVSNIHAASFVPVNEKVFRFRQGDGRVRTFVRDEEEPRALIGEDGWGAEIDGRRALMMNEAASPSQQRGFMFVDGHLRKQLAGGKEADVSVPPPGNDSSAIAALWPEPGKRLVAAQAPDIWKDGDRLRLWFDNPNKAGLLFAELVIAAFALLFFRSVWVRIIGGVVALAAFAGLVQTSSRGAFLSLLCGIAVMGLTRFRSLFTWKRVALIAAIAALAIGGLFASGQFERLGKNLFKEGQRETSRLTVWKTVPGMIVDAPGGWGRGNSARAYIDWYQPKSECLLKDLISGHLTFLVESGWCGRVVYIFLWLAFLFVAMGRAFRGGSPVPAAVFASFAVAACFNPVIAVPELWIVPMVAVVAVVAGAIKDGAFGRNAIPLVLAAIGTVIAAISPFVLAKVFPDEVPVARRNGAVLLNGKSPSVWMADDDYVLHGGYWWLEGRFIRDHFAAHAEAPSLGFVRDVKDLPADAEKLVLVGECGRDFLAERKRHSAKSVVFLSPPFAWTDVPDDLLKACDVSLIAGEHAARLASDGKRPPSWVKVVLGAELYIPGWIGRVL